MCLHSALGNKTARLLVALSLAVTLVPAIPASQVGEAEALTGTTNYRDFFTVSDRRGSPGQIVGSRLRAACSDTPVHYAPGGGTVSSSAAFISKTKVSLLCNWTIKVRVDFQGLSRHASNTKLSADINMGLSNIADTAKLDGVTLSCQKVYEAGKAVVPSLAVKDMANAVGTDRPATVTSITAADSYDVTFDYFSSARTLSLTAASKSVSVGLGSTTIKSASQAYLAIMGTLSAQGSSPTFSSGQAVYITFDSMALPHLNPDIRSVTLYRENGSIINDGDIVAAGTKVRVVCRVYNNDANSSGEQFSMHFKLDKGTTRNITALSGESYPTKVNGSIVSEAVDSTAGVPIVVHGNNNPNNQGNDTVIEYWATVTRQTGELLS